MTLDPTKANALYLRLWRLATPQVQRPALEELGVREEAVLQAYVASLADATRGISTPVDPNPALAAQTAFLRAVLDVQPTIVVTTVAHYEAVRQLYAEYQAAIDAALASHQAPYYAPPDPSGATWHIVPDPGGNGFGQVSGPGVSTKQEFAIEYVLPRLAPGAVCAIDPGTLKKFAVDVSYLPTDPQRWLVASAGPGSVTILANPAGAPTWKNAHALGIHGFRWVNPVTAAFLFATQSDKALDQRGFSHLWFVDCEIDGGKDWRTGTGNLSCKWGTRGYYWDDFVWSGGSIHSIHQEHAIYYSNQKGPVLIENCQLYELGRTMVQRVKRDGEIKGDSGPIPAIASLTLRNVTGWDAALEQGGGGSAITSRGNVDDEAQTLLEGVQYTAGLDAAINAISGHTGTGGVVFDSGDGSGGRGNGRITITDCDFEVPQGDRENVKIETATSADLVHLIASSTKSGNALTVAAGIACTVDGVAQQTPLTRKDLRATP